WTLLRALARSFVLAMRAVGARLLIPLRLVARGLLRLARVIRAFWRPVPLALDLALDVPNFTGEVLLPLLPVLWQPVLPAALHGRIKAPSVRIPGDQAGSTSVQEPAQAVGAGHSADINA